MMTKQAGGMLRLFTTQRFTLHTALAPDVAKQRVSDVLDAQHSLFAKPAYPFYGTIKGEHFQLTRIRL